MIQDASTRRSGGSGYRMTPAVSVLMPVYNSERFLREALESVIGQSLTSFELIVIDDGSTDGSASILKTYRDHRIKVIRHSVNQGLSSALNRGLEVCVGEFIARMDADDVAMPNRLARQVGFLQEHPETGVTGSFCEVIDSGGLRIGTMSLPVTDLAIRWSSLLASPFAHPSTMIRRDVLERHQLRFDPTLLVAADYDLWTRLLRYTRGANLDEPLLRYRIHNESQTTQHRKTQLANRDRIALRTIGEQFPRLRITLPEVSQLRHLFSGGREQPPDGFKRRSELVSLYLDLWRAFAQNHRGEALLRELQRKEALRTARVLLHRPLPPRWWVPLLRLLALSPGLSRYLVTRAFHRAREVFTLRTGRSF